MSVVGSEAWGRETVAQGTMAHGRWCPTGEMAVVSVDGTAGIDVTYQGDASSPVHVLVTSVDDDDVLSLALDVPAAELLLEGLAAALSRMA